ncbi:PP2C family protein-serine/threonine phosphatase [Nonomuraea typhae]|uniref:PP2C family protein-serine/threonine phosphatase n=1 Tax=Nonomuraea typhae TaxID=2603600 RepID=UPI0012FB7E2B|nr:PP2C family serine/threonine-protein phosphatase [Nonomuraea typhae]
MITYATRTRQGRLHAENQDRLAADAAQGTFIVADGIGGLADAAATAQVVVDEFPAHVHARVTTLTVPEVTAEVSAVAADLNERVRRTARLGQGTTGAAIALLLLRGDRALTVHLGDSRIYLARDGVLRRLTDDHSHEGRLTRYVGMPGLATPEVSVHDLRAGDRLLLCTDGLNSRVDDVTLADLLSSTDDVAEVSRRLEGAAVAGGVIDDLSLIAVDYGGGKGV